jgi:pSer/pThr/pTyr-binding forkhead associated (FHA) protein
MAHRCDGSFDPSQPALIVTYGNTAKKHRVLNKPVIVLGRARGCDIGLVAPDVSNVHCVIVRNPNGFYLRDCSSRSGTRLNGDPVTEAMLRDGDILQIGPFSFQAYLPATSQRASGESCAPEEVRKLGRSRRNLARHALGLRRALREGGLSRTEVASQQVDLDRRADVLREQIREVELRAQRLRQAERDLSCDRETLDRELASLPSRIEETKRARNQLRAEAEGEVRAKWEKFREEMGQEEARREKAREPQVFSPGPEAARGLEIRRRELAHYARHLVRWASRLCDQDETRKMIEELKKEHAEMRQWGRNEVEELRRENSRLRQRLAEVAPEDGSRRKDTVHDEPASGELEAARSTVADLGRALADRDRLIEKLQREQKKSAAAAPAFLDGDLPRYEEESAQAGGAGLGARLAPEKLHCR